MPELSNDQITGLATRYLEGALERAREAARTAPVSEYQTEPSDVFGFPGLLILRRRDPDEVERDLQRLKDVERRLRKGLVSREYDLVTRQMTSDVLAKEGIIDVDWSRDDIERLLHAVLRARVEATRIEIALFSGDYDQTQVRDPLFTGFRPPSAQTREAAPPPARPPNPMPAAAGPSLGELADRYVLEKSRDDWVNKTKLDNKRVLGWFLELNDRQQPITGIGLEDIRTYREALRDLPANVVKQKEFEGQPLKDILAAMRERADVGKLKLATAAKYFSKLKAFFAWCVGEGYLDHSPVRNLTLNPPRDAKNRRDAFTLEELKTLFTSPQYAGHHSSARRAKAGTVVTRDGKYWIPLIALFTGMRLGEIVQLLATDVQMIDDVWCFDVSRAEEGEGEVRKQLKTAAAERRVPVHPTLKALGFIDYVLAMQAKSKGTRLFPDIKPGKDGYYSHNFSKYFARYLRSIGIKREKNAFHSFRHNFADACDASEVSQVIKKALMGHADTSVTAIYGSKPAVGMLAASIEKISYKIQIGQPVARA